MKRKELALRRTRRGAGKLSGYDRFTLRKLAEVDLRVTRIEEALNEAVAMGEQMLQDAMGQTRTVH